MRPGDSNVDPSDWEFYADDEPPYRPATCLLCGGIEDEQDLWWHWVEKHTSLNEVAS